MPGVPDIKLIRTDTFFFVPPKGWAARSHPYILKYITFVLKYKIT